MGHGRRKILTTNDVHLLSRSLLLCYSYVFFVSTASASCKLFARCTFVDPCMIRLAMIADVVPFQFVIFVSLNLLAL